MQNPQTHLYEAANLIKNDYDLLKTAHDHLCPNENIFPDYMDTDLNPTRISPEIKTPPVNQTPAQIAAETAIKALSVELCTSWKTAYTDYNTLTSERNSLIKQESIASSSLSGNYSPRATARVTALRNELLVIGNLHKEADLTFRNACKGHVTSITRIIEASACVNNNPPPPPPTIPRPTGNAAAPTTKKTQKPEGAGPSAAPTAKKAQKPEGAAPTTASAAPAAPAAPTAAPTAPAAVGGSFRTNRRR